MKNRFALGLFVIPFGLKIKDLTDKSINETKNCHLIFFTLCTLLPLILAKCSLILLNLAKNSLIMTYFALFMLILADFCPKIAKFPPLCARMYKYNYIRPRVTQILLQFFTFLKAVPISKIASLTSLLTLSCTQRVK